MALLTTAFFLPIGYRFASVAMSDGNDPGQPVSLDQLHNFGEFFFDPNIGLDISHTFEIQNTRWEEPVTLAVVSNSCSCTVAEIVNNTIAFGESAQVTLTTRIGQTADALREYIVLSTGRDDTPPIYLQVAGQPVPLISVSTPEDILDVELGVEKSIELVGVFYSPNLPEEIELSSPHPYVQIREQPIKTEPAQHGMHKTEVRASGLIVTNHFNVAQVGLQVANIYLRADQTEIKTDLRWDCRASFSLSATSLFFSGTEPTEKSLEVDFGNHATTVSAVRCDHPCISVRMIADDSVGGRARCVVTYTNDIAASTAGLASSAAIHIETDHPRYPSILVPARMIFPLQAKKEG